MTQFRADGRRMACNSRGEAPAGKSQLEGRSAKTGESADAAAADRA